MKLMRGLVLAGVCAGLVFGCGDDDDEDDGNGGAGGGGGTGGVVALQCSNRCANRLSACGAPASELANMCNPFCGKSPLENDVSCVETTECQALLDQFSNGVVCGVTTGATSSGGADGG